MFDLQVFLNDCLAARARPDYLRALRQLLQAAIDHPRALAAAFADDDSEETLLYASPLLTMVHVRLSPNVLFPPHNHHMEALIGAYCGGEVHRSYLHRGDGLVENGERQLPQGQVAVCGVRDVHAVANPTPDRSAALHIYCGDLVHTRRQVWPPDLGGSSPYSDELYFRWARPYDPAAPFAAPEPCNAHAVTQAPVDPAVRGRPSTPLH